MSTTFILGLRRSGTTVFWEWFRQDPRNLCFDEPFSEQLMRLPAGHPKGTFTEYQRLIKTDSAQFWHRYAPIHRADELRTTLTQEQQDFLTWLTSQSEHTVVDLSRCHLKAEQLYDIDPDARVIHLHRSSRAFASSHLLPSRSGFRGRALRVALERTFWTRSDRYDFWGLQSIIGTDPGSRFGHLLAEAGHDSDAIYQLPAVGRLLAFSRFMAERLAADGLQFFGSRYQPISFEDFARAPRSTVDDLCMRVGIDAPADTGAIRLNKPSPGHQPDSKRWLDIEARVRVAFS